MTETDDHAFLLGAEPTAEQMDEIEAQFRVYAFNVYYHKSFCEERDHTLRFIKALLASVAPVRDRRPMVD